jgi:hypothetical protein
MVDGYRVLPGMQHLGSASMVSCAVMVLLLSTGLLAAVAVALWYVTRKSQRYSKLSARIGAVALACISALTLLLFVFRGVMCGRCDFPPVSSADGRLIAQVSEEDCGAADSFHSSVQLWREKQGTLAHPFGKREHSMTVFTVGHDPRLLELEWKGRMLLIHYPNDSRSLAEFRCQSKWADVQIECIAYKPDYSKPAAKIPPVKRWLW